MVSDTSPKKIKIAAEPMPVLPRREKVFYFSIAALRVLISLKMSGSNLNCLS